MQQIEFSNNKITLSVKKAPKGATIVLMTLAFTSVLIPLFILVLNVMMGNGLRVMFVFFIGIMGFIGLYLLRMSLWNSRGQEIIILKDNHFTYTADYGWFKDTALKINCENITLTHVPFGHSGEQTGILVIGNDESYKRSVVKIPLEQLDKLVTNYSIK